MDSMLPMMIGTAPEMMPIVTDPVVDALFLGYAVVNLAFALVLYPMSFMNKETIKHQQLCAAIFYLGFLIPMLLMFNAGMMGVQGVASYGVMNGALGLIALKNYMSL